MVVSLQIVMAVAFQKDPERIPHAWSLSTADHAQHADNP
jgi:hypothetical protein